MAVPIGIGDRLLPMAACAVERRSHWYSVGQGGELGPIAIKGRAREECLVTTMVRLVWQQAGNRGGHAQCDQAVAKSS
jgi:hypothetical protein